MELEISSLVGVRTDGGQPGVSLDKADGKCGEGGDIKIEGKFIREDGPVHQHLTRLSFNGGHDHVIWWVGHNCWDWVQCLLNLAYRSPRRLRVSRLLLRGIPLITVWR